MTHATIHWFREDLRLKDNPALEEACNKGTPVVPIYILDQNAGRKLGGASQWWLYKSLQALDASLKAKGSRLYVFKGDSAVLLPQIIDATKATGVYWNRLYDAPRIKRDTEIKETLTRNGIEVRSFKGSLIADPWELAPKSGSGFFQVYSPFWRALTASIIPPLPKPAPNQIVTPQMDLGVSIEALGLRPKISWFTTMESSWTPGEAGAQEKLHAFATSSRLTSYAEDRNRPDILGSSRLSPHLHWGELSPRDVWHTTISQVQNPGDIEVYLKELVWREFSYHVLYHFPELPKRSLRAAYEKFPWNHNQDWIERWNKGETGYPIVDAGMRELWATGWMHNRVRMITGSFLVKHLLQHWHHGEEWFWDTLVDADIAQNTFNWQWVSGCGADASPYFRIFNPTLQGEKFDPQGDYVRKWIPELQKIPKAYAHQPWEYGGTRGYPPPMINLSEGRDRALAALASLKM